MRIRHRNKLRPFPTVLGMSADGSRNASIHIGKGFRLENATSIPAKASTLRIVPLIIDESTDQPLASGSSMSRGDRVLP